MWFERVSLEESHISNNQYSILDADDLFNFAIYLARSVSTRITRGKRDDSLEEMYHDEKNGVRWTPKRIPIKPASIARPSAEEHVGFLTHLARIWITLNVSRVAQYLLEWTVTAGTARPSAQAKQGLNSSEVPKHTFSQADGYLSRI